MKKKYCQYCGKPLEENCDCEEFIAEQQKQFQEDYENDEAIQYGWHQQDTIDMYRREK